MPRPLTQPARDRLREQARREQELAAGVLAAQDRLARQIRKRDAMLAAQARAITEREAAVADALIIYLDQAGVGLDRAAAVLDRPKNELARIVRDRKATCRRDPAHATTREVNG